MQDEGWAGVCGGGGTLPEPACCSTDLLSMRGGEPCWPGARGLWKPEGGCPPFHVIYNRSASSRCLAQVPKTCHPVSSGSH